jgi:hypothetical protein
MPNPQRTAEIWREEAIKAGIGDLYLCRVESMGKIDPSSINFDASVEFAPDWYNRGPYINHDRGNLYNLMVKLKLVTDVYLKNYISSYDDLVKAMLNKPIPEYKWFRCVTPSWDNTARRREGANIFIESTPEKYRSWLSSILEYTIANHSGDESLVFINAWNEWAEGNHLEPDLDFCHQYLKATRDALQLSIL